MKKRTSKRRKTRNRTLKRRNTQNRTSNKRNTRNRISKRRNTQYRTSKRRKTQNRTSKRRSLKRNNISGGMFRRKRTLDVDKFTGFLMSQSVEKSSFLRKYYEYPITFTTGAFDQEQGQGQGKTYQTVKTLKDIKKFYQKIREKGLLTRYPPRFDYTESHPSEYYTLCFLHSEIYRKLLTENYFHSYSDNLNFLARCMHDLFNLFNLAAKRWEAAGFPPKDEYRMVNTWHLEFRSEFLSFLSSGGLKELKETPTSEATSEGGGGETAADVSADEQLRVWRAQKQEELPEKILKNCALFVLHKILKEFVKQNETTWKRDFKRTQVGTEFLVMEYFDCQKFLDFANEKLSGMHPLLDDINKNLDKLDITLENGIDYYDPFLRKVLMCVFDVAEPKTELRPEDEPPHAELDDESGKSIGGGGGDAVQSKIKERIPGVEDIEEFLQQEETILKGLPIQYILHDQTKSEILKRVKETTDSNFKRSFQVVGHLDPDIAFSLRCLNSGVMYIGKASLDKDTLDNAKKISFLTRLSSFEKHDYNPKENLERLDEKTRTNLTTYSAHRMAGESRQRQVAEENAQRHEREIAANKVRLAPDVDAEEKFLERINDAMNRVLPAMKN